ncbi:unnamed protein product [Rotaria magnacalcarata]|uniref:Uncharacterized protein n=1 Tax=Rotaria magnacalcarata TaxID=392030 RepID=A0A819CG79_9BILA|nr:unnamed protein product [Rotaria magnacalcarata]
MILIFIFINFMTIQSKLDEIFRTTSNNFLQSKVYFPVKYEESRETTEARRELCLDEFRQHETHYRRRPRLSSVCAHYCTTTMNCQSNQEQSACVSPLWSPETIKYVQKFKRICYVRITEILQYKQAKQMCHRYDLQLATIDNIQLLERLQQLNMFNTTCKGQCPKSRGYYIGLKRLLNQSKSKWIWSNNVSWTENEIDCDDYSHTSYANSSILCYIGSNGPKKITVWNENEPNNFRSPDYRGEEQCVEIIVHTGERSVLEKIDKLNDIPCPKPTFDVICQVEDTKSINITRFESFAKINDFTNIEDLLTNFENTISLTLETLVTKTQAFEDLLNRDSFTTTQTTNILNMFDQLVNVTGQIKVEDSLYKSVTNKLLQFLDSFSAKIQIGSNRSISFEYENMNLSIFDINFQNESNEWCNINTNKYMNTIIEINIQALKKQVIQSKNYRIVETIFSNFNLFPQINITNFGVPLSYQIANFTTIKADNDLIRFQIQVSESLQSYNIACAYWSFDKNNGSWVADRGCRFAGYVNNYAQCYCNHLTHFAVLMISNPQQSLELLSAFEELILTFVTYIGISLSIFGLVTTLITYVLFRDSQKNRSHISLMMLCLSILFVNCFYIPFSFTQSSSFKLNQHLFCTILGFLFHYFFIASFMWMLIMAIVQYNNFVRILNTHISHFYIKSCTIGWIVPLIFPSLVIVLGHNRGYTEESRCWINNQNLLNLTFLLPISTIILFNLILFGFILRSIFRHNAVVATQKKKYSKVQIGATLCCFVSIGCTWLFGFIVLIDPSFNHQLIFSICSSFQGFLIFLFHVYLSKPKRASWQSFFVQHGCHSHSNVSSDHKEITTVSYSTGRNASEITSSSRSNISRASTFSAADEHKTHHNLKTPTTTDHKRNELLNVVHLELSRL